MLACLQCASLAGRRRAGHGAVARCTARALARAVALFGRRPLNAHAVVFIARRAVAGACVCGCDGQGGGVGAGVCGCRPVGVARVLAAGNPRTDLTTDHTACASGLFVFACGFSSALSVRVCRGDCRLAPVFCLACFHRFAHVGCPLHPSHVSLAPRDADVCWIKGDVLEAARRAFGTDEDIIAVAPADGLSLPSAPRPPPPLAARGAGGAPQQLQQDGGPRPAVPPGATVFASTVATTGRP